MGLARRGRHGDARARGSPAAAADVFDRIVYQKTLLEMMQAGYLVDLRALHGAAAGRLRCPAHAAGRFCRGGAGDPAPRGQRPGAGACRLSDPCGGAQGAAVYLYRGPGLCHGRDLRMAGIPAEALDGTTPLATRRAILRRLHTGETRVVANCAVLTEGFDEPSVDCVIVARPTQSARLYQQMLGRGTRTYPGKTDCLVLDVVGVSTQHTLHTAAALFHCDAGRLAPQSVLEILERPVPQDQEEDAPLAGTLRSTPVDPSARRTLRCVTRQGAWVLSLGAQHGTLRLRPDGPETWQVVKCAATRSLCGWVTRCRCPMRRGWRKTIHGISGWRGWWRPKRPGGKAAGHGETDGATAQARVGRPSRADERRGGGSAGRGAGGPGVTGPPPT